MDFLRIGGKYVPFGQIDHVEVTGPCDCIVHSVTGHQDAMCGPDAEAVIAWCESSCCNKRKETDAERKAHAAGHSPHSHAAYAQHSAMEIADANLQREHRAAHATAHTTPYQTHAGSPYNVTDCPECVAAHATHAPHTLAECPECVAAHAIHVKH